MQNVVSAFNSSIQFNKKNFWIDPVTHNQYYVGVSYPEEDIKSIETLLDIPITSPKQRQPINLRSLVRLTRTQRPDGGQALQHPAHNRAHHGGSGPRPRARL